MGTTPIHLQLPTSFPNLAASDLVQQICLAQEEVNKHQEKARADYKWHAAKHQQRVPTYSVGHKAWLSMEHLHTNRPTHKLDFQFLALLRSCDRLIQSGLNFSDPAL